MGTHKGKNIVSVDAVADYFLLKINADDGDSITNLKIQKLVYYGQAWCLACLSRPLFSEEIQAWFKGPVCPPLYRRFKKAGWQAIDPTQYKTNPLKELTEEERGLLDKVWIKYSPLSSSQLIDLTHAESPWKEAYGGLRPGTRCQNIIEHNAMRDFYKKADLSKV